MPVYLLKCAEGHSFEVFKPMAEAPQHATCECGQLARRDYAAEHPTSVVGMVDGEQIGYFPPEAGPYVDPGRSLKRAVKNKHAWNEMVKRSEGRIGDVS